MTDSNTSSLPTEFVDAHHHFLDTKNNDFSREFLGSLLKDTSYLPHEYQKDVVEPLEKAGIKLIGSVHIEAMPDDGWKEAEWVSSQKSTVTAIVASCALADAEHADANLEKLKQNPKVKGIRWILDCVGPFEPNTATHVATLRHDGVDYLRGSNGDYSGEAVPEFEAGFSLLAKYGFSFDLQCAPAQLLQAAALFSRHPSVPVCIDHFGKPRLLLGPNDDVTLLNEPELAQWRAGMKAMAKLPHVFVKISMLGYAVPGWIQTPERVALLKGLVLEIVDLFGANRCMVALNWWKDGAMSDADGLSDAGPDPVQFVQYMSSFFSAYSEEDRKRLFSGTAREFYKF